MSEIQEMLKVYKTSLSNKMNLLTAPLKTFLGIDECIYTNISNKGYFFAISNQPEASEYYFSQHFYKSTLLIRHPENYSNGAILPMAIHNEAREPSMVDRFGFSSDSLLAFFIKDQKGAHKFLFNRKNEGTSIINFYIQNLLIFEEFCNYYIEELNLYQTTVDAHTIDISQLIGTDFFKINFPQNLGLFAQKDNKIDFLKEIGSISKDYTPSAPLSPQEAICLKSISSGRTLRETAVLMQLSKRTVESYFESIKNKMACWTKSEVLQKANHANIIGN